MPVFNYSDYANDRRNVICSNPIAEIVASCTASNSAPTFPRIRNNSAYAMDIDSVRNTLESMAPNAVFGDLAGLRDIQTRSAMSHAANAIATMLHNKKENRRRWELERIKRLLSSKATIRYRIEVK